MGGVHRKQLPSYHRDRYPDAVVIEAAGHQVEIRQNDWCDDFMRYTVWVDGIAVQVVDHADGQAQDEQGQRMIASVLKALDRGVMGFWLAAMDGGTEGSWASGYGSPLHSLL